MKADATREAMEDAREFLKLTLPKQLRRLSECTGPARTERMEHIHLLAKAHADRLRLALMGKDG